MRFMEGKINCNRIVIRERLWSAVIQIAERTREMGRKNVWALPVARIF
jgi:hypothetical protein